MSAIAVVVGNQNLRSVLVAQLQQQGYRVQHTASMVAAKAHLLEFQPDMVVVDYDLSDGNGLELCEWIQIHTDALILMISTRLEESEIEASLAVADDYLKKPFGMKEFLARVAAILRRSSSRRLPSEIVRGDLRIDMVRRRVFFAQESITGSAGEAIDLTPQEFSLLYVLLQSPDEPIDRAELLRRAWDEHMGGSRTVDTHILALRKKLKDPDIIQTIRQMGYQIHL
jgi:two-component system, OmpR family, response regulator